MTSIRPRLRQAALVAVLATGAALLPVTSAPAAQPQPVAPVVHQVPVRGVDPAALADLGAAPAGGAATTSPAAPADSAAPAVSAATAGRLAVLTRAQSTRPFRLVGLTWDAGQAAPTGVAVRTRVAGAWGPWEPLEISADGPDAGTPEAAGARRGAQPLLVPGADGVQLRVDSTDGTAPSGLRLELVDPGSSRADGAVAATPPASAAAAASTPAIVTRAQWGADESLREPVARYLATVKVGFVHHSASSNSYWQTSGWTAADAAKDIRAIYAYDTRGLGYADIAYNFLVDQAGRVYEGRAGGVTRAVQSAATGGFNTDTFAVAALGNLDTAAPTSALVDGVSRIVAWKLDLFHRDPYGASVLTSAGGGTSRYAAGQKVSVSTVSGHRDVGATACPGRYLYPTLATIRAKAKEYQGAAIHSPVLATASGLQGAATARVSASVPGAQDWRLTVRAACTGNAVVRTTTGTTSGAGPLAVTWDGRTSSGAWAPVGRYGLLLESWSATTGTARSATLDFDVLAPGSGTLTCPNVTRLRGADRYATSVAVGRTSAPAARTAVLVSGEDGHLVDGLVAAPLARAKGAPLLLTTAGGLPAPVVADLEGRGVTRVWIVGGSSVVSPAVESALRALGADVTRVHGADRYATAAAVAREVGSTGTAVVASGEDAHLVDALAAGGAAAGARRPILLVRRDAVPEPTAQAVRDLGLRGVTVVGGTGVVSDAVVADLPGAYRAAGADRFATAAAVATAFRSLVDPSRVVVSSGVGTNLVDALPGGALGQLTLLTAPARLSEATRAWVAGQAVTTGTVLGGTAAVSDAALLDLAQAVG